MKERATGSGAVVEPCDAVVEPIPAAAVDDDDPSVLEGVYRVEITEADLTAGRVTNPDDVAINAGVYTWTLDDGRWIYDQRSSELGDQLDGTYTVDGDGVTFTSMAQGWQAPLTWALADDGSIQFTVPPDAYIHPIHAVAFAAHPWTRIGDVESG